MSVLFFVCSSNTKYGHNNTLACSYLPIVVTMVAAKLKQQHAVVRSIMCSCFLDLLSSLSFTPGRGTSELLVSLPGGTCSTFLTKFPSAHTHTHTHTQTLACL